MKESNKFCFKAILFGLTGTIFCLNSCSDQKHLNSNNEIPEFKVVLNNNPLFQGDSIHGRQVSNIPLILIYGLNVEEKAQLKLQIFNSKSEVISHSDFVPEVNENKFTHQIILSNPLADPQKAKIEYLGKAYSYPIRLQKIYGRVTDFNDNPISVYFLVNWDCDAYLRAISGDDGNYCLWLPEEKVIHIFIDNASYGKSTLECFMGHEFVLKNDINVDINIDRMELYNMRSWASFTSFNIYFIPMSLTRAQNQKVKDTREEWPSLTNDRIILYVNNKEIPNKNLTIMEDILDFKTKQSRPAYILSFDLNEILDAYEKSTSVVIKVVAKDSLIMNNRLYHDQGQAYIINPSYD